jgi:hypothetical protein
VNSILNISSIQEHKTSKLAITSLALGILAYILLSIQFVFISIPGLQTFYILGRFIDPTAFMVMGLISFAIGIVSIMRIRKNPKLKGKVFAIIGIILGIIPVLLLLLFLLVPIVYYFNFAPT